MSTDSDPTADLSDDDVLEISDEVDEEMDITRDWPLPTFYMRHYTAEALRGGDSTGMRLTRAAVARLRAERAKRGTR